MQNSHVEDGVTSESSDELPNDNDGFRSESDVHVSQHDTTPILESAASSSA